MQLVWPAIPGTAPTDYALRGCGAASPGDAPGACPAPTADLPPTAPPALQCPACPFLAATLPAAALAGAASVQVVLRMGGVEVVTAPPVVPAADASGE